jgi:hypothetical protein
VLDVFRAVLVQQQQQQYHLSFYDKYFFDLVCYNYFIDEQHFFHTHSDPYTNKALINPQLSYNSRSASVHSRPL